MERGNRTGSGDWVEWETGKGKKRGTVLEVEKRCVKKGK